MGDRMKPSIMRRGSSGAKHKVFAHKFPKTRVVLHDLTVHREHPKEEKSGVKLEGGSPKDSVKEKRTKGQKLERWLLTRKTWRYMADAGRKLIPDGVHNRPEDIPKIEAYFQEVCHKEPRFLLWRKQSYPGALGFRSRGRTRGGRLKKGGSCRDKTSSADEADESGRSNSGLLQISATSGGRFDVQKLKREFLQGASKSMVASGGTEQPMQSLPHVEGSHNLSSADEDALLLNTVQMYLNEKDLNVSSELPVSQKSINHGELLDKLREHLSTIDKIASKDRRTHRASVHFEGDKTQLMLLETLRRHFSKSTSKERVISDLLTDRKLLERLYFDLRRARGFTAGRRGTGIMVPGGYSSLSSWQPSWKLDYEGGNGSDYLEKVDELKSAKDENTEKTSSKLSEPKIKAVGTQTDPISPDFQSLIDEEVRKLKAAKAEAEAEPLSPRSPTGTVTRRSSVDNDDISPSVSDTIKRYLRMARKKSIDSDKADRFKRVNYDKNIRNIKSKGEIPPVSDIDEFNKNEQTEESWLSFLKDGKFDRKLGELSPVFTDKFSSGRSSFDTATTPTTTSTGATELEDTLSPPLSPATLVKSPSGILSSGQTFLSNLLHGLQHHPNVTNAPNSMSTASAGMQKSSKSTSNMVQQGSRLVSKKIWKSRSKSQPRIAVTVTPFWSPHPQVKNTWVNSAGVQVTLTDTTILHLSEIERRVLQKVALAKLQALNLGVTIKIPSETVAAPRKRRPYLMKRKALTTGIFEPSRNKEDSWAKDDKVLGSGLVFGISLGQCLENERKAKISASTPGTVVSTPTLDADYRRKSHHGSHPSFPTLDAPGAIRFERKGSTESLSSQSSNIPTSLDSMLSQIPSTSEQPFDPGVPNIVLTCLNVIEQHGLNTEGVFRVGSSKNRVRQMREEFDCGRGNELLTNQKEIFVHDAATLLKEYLRELPDPLLCKDLYPAFIHTQRLQNQRLQIESIQHLLQLLPAVHRDTLWHLLRVLVCVANNSKDYKDNKGSLVKGNKMDVSNLSTLFAPNILYSDKDQVSGKYALSPAGAEERADAINVVRFLIERHRELFSLSADLLNEVYLHMMDSHPEALDQLLRSKIPPSEIACDPENENNEEIAYVGEPFCDVDGNSVDSIQSITSFGEDHSKSQSGGSTGPENETPKSSSSSTIVGSEKKVWSREEFTHENAGTGGPDFDLRRRHERIPDRSKRRSRDETRRTDGALSWKSSSSSSSHPTPDDVRASEYIRRSSSHHQQSNGDDEFRDAITGSLKISARPRGAGPSTSLALNLDDSDIPYIEDSGNISAESLRQSVMDRSKIGSSTMSIRGKLPTDSDSSSTSPPYYQTTPQQLSPGYELSHSVSSPPGNTTSSVCSLSSGSELGFTSPPSWASSPPASPDSAISSVNYIPEPIVSRIIIPSKMTTVESPTVQRGVAKISDGQKASRSFVYKISSGKSSDHRRSSGTESSDTLVKTSGHVSRATDKVLKSASSSAVSSNVSSSASKKQSVQPKVDRASERPVATSISSIGGAVLRSKTADIERMLSSSSVKVAQAAGSSKSGGQKSYGDARHSTKHLNVKEAEATRSGSISGPVPQARSKSTIWKRKEIISSEPKKERHFL